MRTLISLVVTISLAGCFSPERTASDACKAAFQTYDIAVSNYFQKNAPLVYNNEAGLIAYFSWEDSYGTGNFAECLFAVPIEEGSPPDLLGMVVNQEVFSDDALLSAQGAIIEWWEVEHGLREAAPGIVDGTDT